MKPRKYATKLKLSPVRFEDAIKALLKVKPPEDEKKTEKPNLGPINQSSEH